MDILDDDLSEEQLKNRAELYAIFRREFPNGILEIHEAYKNSKYKTEKYTGRTCSHGNPIGNCFDCECP